MLEPSERAAIIAKSLRDLLGALGASESILATAPFKVATLLQDLQFNDPAWPKLSLLKVPLSAGEHLPLVELAGLSFCSFCEHHLLPFFGEVKISYRPNPALGVASLGSLARLVQVCASRLTIQEKLTADLFAALSADLQPRELYLEIKARHLCFELTGNQRENATLCTKLSSLGTV